MDSHQGSQASKEGVRKYAAYQGDIYIRGMFNSVIPTVTTDPNKLEIQAKERMSKDGFNYVAGGAGERATMDANRLAFRQWKIVPRMLRDTAVRNLGVKLFGEDYETPILIAPVGVHTIFHDDGEVGVAEVAAELGIPFILSTAASASIEDVAKASGDGRRWYQLYWPESDEVTVSLLNRAQNAGYKVLVVTLDTWILSWRPWDLDSGYLPFAKGIGTQILFSDPVFRQRFKEHTGKQIEDNVVKACMAWQQEIASGKGHKWEDLKLLKKHWDGPIVLKGIQHPEDAIKAVEAGVDGIIVSNHGGRQLDGAVGSLDMLPEIVDAVGDKTTVLFDSGVRTGTDIIKALCLGARAVLVGRPWVYGLGVAGKAGAKHVLQSLLAVCVLSCHETLEIMAIHQPPSPILDAKDMTCHGF